MTIPLKRPGFCLLMVAMWVFVRNAAAEPANPDWLLGVWQSDDGLPNNNVVGLAQTTDGYLWLAMPDGLARFDGSQFEDFPMSTFAPEIADHRIRSFLKTQQGGLCLAIGPGRIVFLYHGSTEIFTNGLPRLNADSLAQAGDGSLWITLGRKYVYQVKNGVATEMNAAQGLPADGAWCALATDNQGQIWFAKGNEIGVFRNGRFKTLLQLPIPAAQIAPARDGGIWIVSGFQLAKFQEGKPLFNCGPLKGGTLHGSVNAILEDRSGAVWIGTSANGLFRYDGRHFEDLPASDADISSLIEDREGNIWAGTEGGGLDRLCPRAITLENSDSGAPFNVVQSICQDSSGVVWAVTDGGNVICNNHGEWEPVTNTEIDSAMANCVAADGDGNVWIATRKYELIRWRDGRVTSLGQNDGLKSRVINGVLVDHSGKVWLAGEWPDAVQYYSAGVFHYVTIPSGAHHLRSLAEDRAGNIWAAGDSGILLKISNGRATDETAVPGNARKWIRCLFAADDGSLWIGFSAGNLGRLKDGKYSSVDISQGINMGAINEILNDGRGSYWFGADRGIFRARETELKAAADGQLPALAPIHYGRSAQLPSVQAMYGSFPDALKSSDGRLWIPMRNSLVIVQPEKVREDSQPPSVLVNRVTLDDQTLALYGGEMPTDGKVDLARSTSPLRLPPGFHRLEFDFTSLSFGPPENIHFRYALQGFDSEWRDAGISRQAIYSRLPAGKYSFCVKGCNGDGIWNDAGIAIPFVIAPFFWQTWWFRLSTVVLFTLLVVAIVRYVSFRRLRLKLQLLEQQAALDRERARIARDIHDDLGGSLTQVALLSGMALRDAKSPGKSQAHIEQISSTAHQVIKSLDEIVWAVNPRNDTLPDLINYLGQSAVDFLRTAGISCRVDLPNRPPPLPVRSETRHNLYLVVKEALNNIARHAHASEAEFGVSLREKSISIVIADNGQGFCNGESAAFAEGVGNMNHRMEEIGGELRIESAPQKGTRVELIFPRRES